jgi:hypothetical protein
MAAAAGGFTVTAAMSTPSSTDDTVIAIHGDTVKDPVARSGRGDGTPVSTNIVLTGITARGID